MAKKFYAVRNGRVPGVYMTWADCEKQVKGFGGAIYKSFPTEAEALAFVEDSGLSLSDFMSANKSEPKSSQDVKPKSISSRPVSFSSRTQSKVTASVVNPDFTKPNHVVAYIDGSYNKGTNTVGAGGVIFLNGNRETFSFPSTDERYTSFWNVAGELLAAMYVMNMLLIAAFLNVHFIMTIWALKCGLRRVGNGIMRLLNSTQHFMTP